VTGLALQGEQYSCLVLFTVTESQTLVFSVQSGHKVCGGPLLCIAWVLDK
jgi:hypothetical protein